MEISSPIKRNANMDFLRIISMLLIIWLHSIDHSGVIEVADATGGVMGGYVHFSYMLVQVCVNIYVLISGYFLVTSKFRLQKLITLWMEVVFYSLVIKIVFMATGYTSFSLASLVSCLIPIVTGRYWFITIYFGMYLLSPFLNIAIKAMNEKQHLHLNVLLFLLFSGMISIYPSFKGMNSGNGWGLAWFVVLYFLGAWFRLYYQKSGKYVSKIVGWIGIAVVVTLLYKITIDFTSIHRIVDNWYRYDSVPAYAMSLLLFTAFLNVEIHSQRLSKWITAIAPTTLGVYLIHKHASFSPWSWEVLNLPEKMSSGFFPLIQLAAVLGIFGGCVVVDMIRKCTVGRFEGARVIKSVSDWIQNRIGGL